jgi:hypothetical protein
MKKEICPTCGHAIDPGSLTQRIVVMLNQASFPISPAAIRNATGATSGTVYQTLRRLAERGVIRRASRGGMSGWEINPSGENDQPRVTTPDYSAMEPTPAKEAATGVVWASVAQLNKADEFPSADSLLDMLVEMQRGKRADLEWAIWSMGRSGILRTRPDGGLEMPENVRGE